MAIEDIQRYHKRFLQLSDRFKALWTFHQMLQAIWRHFQGRQLPYSVPFKELYDTIRGLPPLFQGLPPQALERKFSEINESINRYFLMVQEADRQTAASHIRHFFEQRVNAEDQDKILYQIIKFYLYSQKIDTGIRDKLDYLITHLSSQYSEAENRHILRDRNHLKEVFEKLMTVGEFPAIEERLKEEYMTLLQELRQEVLTCQTLEDFVLSGILKAIRSLKSRMGSAFLHPDILLKVAELNVATKNQYTDIYRKEEKNLLEDTTRIKRLKDSGGVTSPELQAKIEEIEKMQSVLFSESPKREVKIEHLAEYKNSVRRILEELDTRFDFDLDRDLAPALPTPMEEPDVLDEEVTLGTLLQLGQEDRIATGFKLEKFEFQALKAYQLLHSMDLLQERDRLIIRGAIIRYHIDMYVADMLDIKQKGQTPNATILAAVEEIIREGQSLEKQIQWLLDEALFHGSTDEVQVLSKARYRLTRNLSGLWLLYDGFTESPAEDPTDAD